MRVTFLRTLSAFLLTTSMAPAMAIELTNFSQELQSFAAGEQGHANVLIIGDSISGDTFSPLYASLNQAYGNGGITGGPGQLGLLTQYSSGTSVSTANYNTWIAGYTLNVPNGESVTYQKAVSLAVAQSPTPVMTELKVYYRTQPGGGTFSVQTAQMNGYYPKTFSVLPGYESISTDGPEGMGVLTIPINPGADVSWKVTTTSGTVNILNGGWEGVSGIHFNYMLSLGGSQLVDYASTPENVWSSFLNDVAPDLVLVMVKDDATSGFRNALVTIQQRIQAANPLADTIFVGAYNSQRDDPGYTPAPPSYQTMAAENTIIQDVVSDPSVPGSKYYWDAGAVIGTWASANAKGWFSDSTHLNDSGRAVLANAFAQDFNLLPVPEPACGIFVTLGLGMLVLYQVGRGMSVRRAA